jgi:hypothetical protein
MFKEYLATVDHNALFTFFAMRIVSPTYENIMKTRYYGLYYYYYYIINLFLCYYFNLIF